jgi:hypothetical protein
MRRASSVAVAVVLLAASATAIPLPPPRPLRRHIEWRGIVRWDAEHFAAVTVKLRRSQGDLTGIDFYGVLRCAGTCPARRGHVDATYLGDAFPVRLGFEMPDTRPLFDCAGTLLFGAAAARDATWSFVTGDAPVLCRGEDGAPQVGTATVMLACVSRRGCNPLPRRPPP